MSYQFFAFISYRHTDVKEARRLQLFLERYHLPATLKKQHPDWPKKFKVFRDVDELTSGVLSDELQKKLRASKFLVVICSPNSAQSKYVGDEIAYFRSLGREKQIIPFIIHGEPHTKDRECYHPQLTLGGLELLGIDVQKENLPLKRWRFHKAFVRLVAKMLDMDFGVLWNRRKHYLLRLYSFSAATVILFAALAVFAFQSRPFDLAVRLSASQPALPLSATGTDSLFLHLNEGDVRGKAISALDQCVEFPNLPGKYKGEKVRMRGTAYGFLPLDTVVQLEKNLEIRLHRNPKTYGHIRYLIADNESGAPLSGVVFDFGFQKVRSDAQGLLTAEIPLPHQKLQYPVRISHQGTTLHLTYGQGKDQIQAAPEGDLLTIFVEE